MKNRILTTIITLIIILLFTPSFAMAETDIATDSSTPLIRASAKLTQAAQKKADIQANRVEKLKEKANKEIDRRIDSLNKLITKINNIKRLTTDQKSSLVAQIQSQIDQLNSLKTKIAADTDIATLKTDVQSIVTSYRIYLLYIPKIHILTGSDVMLETADKLTEISNKLQTRITEAKAQGKDVSSLETTLASMQSKITDAKKQAEDAKNAVLPLTPEGYPGNKTTLESARKMLQTGRQDLNQARIDAKTIINGLKSLKINTSTSTATPSSQ